MVDTSRQTDTQTDYTPPLSHSPWRINPPRTKSIQHPIQHPENASNTVLAKTQPCKCIQHLKKASNTLKKAPNIPSNTLKMHPTRCWLKHNPVNASNTLKKHPTPHPTP